MNKKILFGLIGAIFATGAFGEATTQTVTTQNYVDTNFQTKIPAKSGNLNTVITSTDTAGTVGQRNIYDYTYAYYDDTLAYDANAGKYLAGMEAVNSALQYVTNRTLASSPGGDSNSTHELPIFPQNIGGDKFDRIITTNTLNYTGTWGTNNVIPSLMAVNAGMESKQNKMTCTRWLDTPENPDHTDENCLLWELSN